MLEYDDGWLPCCLRDGYLRDGGLADDIARLRERANRRVPVIVHRVPAGRAELDTDANAETLLNLRTAPETETLHELDTMAKLILTVRRAPRIRAPRPGSRGDALGHSPP